MDIRLKKNKARILDRKHPWIFSGALEKSQSLPENGEVVRVLDHSGNFLAKGHYQNASIAIRILTYKDEEMNEVFYQDRLRNSLKLRRDLVESEDTNAFRWVHGEGDSLGGLILDYYNGHVVMECHSEGMYRDRQSISSAIKEVLPDVKTIYCKRPAGMRGQMDHPEDDYLAGSEEQTEILENGLQFMVNWKEGQKTGFFLDQRDNRKLLNAISKGKEVLNLFSYSGGFSIYAAAAEAKSVVSVDVSKKAMEWLEKNIQLNSQLTQSHKIITSDVKDFMKKMGVYDIVVVDPPAFAKSNKKKHNAVQAYKRLNAQAISAIRPGGYLLTFSCSQVVDPVLFENTITAAFIETGRSGQIIKKLSQGMDHPVLINHNEGHYLKGLFMRLF